MRWFWKIGLIAGMGIHRHATFLLLIGLYALTGWARNGNALEAMQITTFVLAFFGTLRKRMSSSGRLKQPVMLPDRVLLSIEQLPEAEVHMPLVPRVE